MSNGSLGNGWRGRSKKRDAKAARLWPALFALSLIVLMLPYGCGGEERPPSEGLNQTGASTGSTRASSTGAGGGGGAPSSDGAGGGGGEGPGNCGNLLCRGHSSCIVEDGAARCVCDEGYLFDDEEEVCIVDESCVKLRSLERRGCRILVGGERVVSVFFAVDFCAGTAVLPDKLEEISDGFQILEDDVDITGNPESEALVIERNVESYVTLAVDVSSSLTVNESLIGELSEELRDFVADLEPGSGDAPVGVSVLLFGINVVEYVPFTTNLAEVDAALERLGSSPDEVIAELGIGDGTALNDAVNIGVRHTERIINLRELVSNAGVLSTGTFVVVTDGRENGGAELDERLIEETVVNVISIGISGDIVDAELTAIGRDGSFLAPERGDWAAAFDEITERVQQYPERAYLLAYCPSFNDNDHTLAVQLLNDTLAQSPAACEFRANALGMVDCNLDFLENACAGRECGGIFACGACAAGECCAGNTCVGPSSVPENTDCHEVDALCEGGGSCEPQDEGDESRCVAYIGEGEECGSGSDGACAPGVLYCDEDDDVCVPVTLVAGNDCARDNDPVAELCPTSNCAARNPKNPSQGYECKPREARMFEPCSGTNGNAICEYGAFCDGGECGPGSVFGCSDNDECLFGQCHEELDVCLSASTCRFSWDSKMND